MHYEHKNPWIYTVKVRPGNSGAWQRQTDFQESVGITPTPGMAIIVNLQTMKVYQKDFRVQESDFIEPKHAEPASLS